MSTEAMATATPPSHRSQKFKDKSDRKSSKKRRHEEQSQSQSQDIDAVEDITTPSKPSKKRRKSEKHTTDTVINGETTAAVVTFTSTAVASLQDTHTPFVRATGSLLLPLAPQAYSYPLQGLCAEHLSPLLLTYYPPLQGIVLSYSSPRISERPHPEPSYLAPSDADAQPLVLARTVDEYAAPLVWLTADFLLLRPKRGTYLAGAVRVQNPSWLGLVCWNYFSAGIPKRRLPPSWKWVEGQAGGALKQENGDVDEELEYAQEEVGEAAADVDTEDLEGYWVDGEGKKVQGIIEFRLRDFESLPTTEREKGFTSLGGTLLSEEEDRKADAELKEQEKAKNKDKGKRRARTGEA